MMSLVVLRIFSLINFYYKSKRDDIPISAKAMYEKMSGSDVKVSALVKNTGAELANMIIDLKGVIR